MDGNGRWARRRGKPASYGHRAGVRTIKRVLDACEKLGVQGAVDLRVLDRELVAASRRGARPDAALPRDDAAGDRGDAPRGVRIVVSGRRDDLSPRMRERIEEAMRRTAGNTNGVLNVCLNYGGRAEIVDAVRRVVSDGIAACRHRRGCDLGTDVQPRAAGPGPHHPNRR